MEITYKTNKDVTYFCSYHVVWCPKYRRKVLTGAIEARLKELITDACASIQADIIKMEIMPDHVELTLSVDPQYGIHKAVKHIKAVTSKVLRQEFTELTTKLPTLWTNAYLLTTTGKLPDKAIQEFIQSQKTSQRQ